MTIAELKIELQKLNVSEFRYSLLEGFKPDAIVLDKVFGVWEVYSYIDKGETSDKKYFWDEGSACKFILKKFSESRV
jgi:hypothetical protein